MSIRWYSRRITLSTYSIIVTLVYSSLYTMIVLGSSSHKLVKRERAFDLAHLELDLEREEDRRQRSLNARIGNLLRDEAINDELCQKRCNDQLRSGLDMVKAHMAFGSIGVPPVIDSTDLTLFCRLDAQHDRCLRDCGFTVQFNMRDYVCRRHYQEMNVLLPCFAHAAPMLKRHCGSERCGPYDGTETTILGYAHRCRTLVCDMMCTRSVLLRRCGIQQGIRATKYLFSYTREQVNFWMQELANRFGRRKSETTPYSCARLFCDTFDLRNCTIWNQIDYSLRTNQPR